MKTIYRHYRKVSSFLLIILLLLSVGCRRTEITEAQTEVYSEDRAEEQTENRTDSVTGEAGEAVQALPADKIEQVDWADYFAGLEGAAVFYIPDENRYLIYNQETAGVRRSPCSTFKIISSLIGLENGVINQENSVRSWSGEEFWNKDWNRDIDFEQAFKTSCIWYFREVIDELGAEKIKKELYKLKYGNCDISDWAGKENTNNNNPALTGFWVESSLKISAKEQAEVMERIFGPESAYRAETLSRLKQAMTVTEQETSNAPIYGKTGMGKKDDIVVDAWFSGFTKAGEQDIYFCVYLGRTDGMDVSGRKAKEIAVRIAANCGDIFQKSYQ